VAELAEPIPMCFQPATPMRPGGPESEESVSPGPASAKAAPSPAGTIHASTGRGDPPESGPACLHGFAYEPPARLRSCGLVDAQPPGFSGSHRGQKTDRSASRNRRGPMALWFVKRQDPKLPRQVWAVGAAFAVASKDSRHRASPSAPQHGAGVVIEAAEWASTRSSGPASWSNLPGQQTAQQERLAVQCAAYAHRPAPSHARAAGAGPA